MFDDVVGLGSLAPAEYFRNSLLGYYSALLETSDRLLDDRHDRGDIGLLVPARQGDKGLATAAMQCAHDEVGGSAEPGIDLLLDPTRIRLRIKIYLQR